MSNALLWWGIEPLNGLAALLTGAAILALVYALTAERRSLLSHVESLHGGGQRRLRPFESLQRTLDQAHYRVTAREFVLWLAALGIVGFFVLWAISGAPLGGLFGLVGAPTAYVWRLRERAQKALSDYEDDQPQVVARLIVGATVEKGGGLQQAAAHVARFGPLNVREDWDYIAKQLRAGAPAHLPFQVIAEKRGSQVLNSIFELLLLRERTGVGLSDILPPIQKSLEERVRLLRTARVKLANKLNEITLMYGLMFAGCNGLGLLFPVFREAQGTPLGSVILVIGWAVATLGFVFARVSVQRRLAAEITFEGGLSPTVRVRRSAPGMEPAPLSLGAD